MFLENTPSSNEIINRPLSFKDVVDIHMEMSCTLVGINGYQIQAKPTQLIPRRHLEFFVDDKIEFLECKLFRA